MDLFCFFSINNKKKMPFLITMLTFFFSQVTNNHIGKWFLIRDVGQGSWSTIIDNNKCTHFDMGGEYFYEIAKEHCKEKNTLLISHYEYDHTNFVKFFIKKRALCKILPGKAIKGLSKCLQNNISLPSKIKKIYPSRNQIPLTNSQSRVFTYNKILIPGDSLSKQEKIWSNNSELKKVRIIILGHHGSNTSTSSALLSRLKNVKMLVSSSRNKKYGHPNIYVKNRIKNKFNTEVISTEVWGNLWFED